MKCIILDSSQFFELSSLAMAAKIVNSILSKIYIFADIVLSLHIFYKINSFATFAVDYQVLTVKYF